MPDFNPKPPERRATIVTAWIHPDDLHCFHRARSKFFPGHRNFLSAHLTLFHHIRPGVRDRFIERARRLVEDYPTPFPPLLIKPPFSMGKGVAYGIEAPPLIELRRPLRDHFGPALTEQDARPWKKPHITVQNKVSRAEAERLARHLLRIYRPGHLRVLGLEFHRYDYGPWTLLGRAGFSGVAP